MRRGIAVLFTIAISASALAAPDDETLPVPLGNQSRSWGRLQRVVRPEYPALALNEGRKGVVEVVGTATGSGLLKDISYAPATPDDAVFVDAVTAVAPYWMFYPALGRDCLPTPQSVRVKVEFEIERGEPRIFVTHAPDPPRKTNPNQSPMRSTKRVEPYYPLYYNRRGLEGRVFSKLRVAPDGQVSEVRSNAFPAGAFPAFVYRTGSRLPEPFEPAPQNDDLALFVLAADEAVMQWRFTPAPEGSDRPRFACLEFNFKLQR